jgi:AraC-like DNA-binding protein
LDRRIYTAIQFLSSAITNAVNGRGNLPAGSGADEREITDRFLLAEMARSANLSLSRLRALFKDETGMTPAQYVKRLKIEKAKKLAENSNMTIGEILASIGVSDESHFRRDFKKAIGITLSECRDSHNNQLQKEEPNHQRFQILSGTQSNRPADSQIGQ